MSDRAIEPYTVTQAVEQFVDECYREAGQYENVSLLDEGQVYSLHLVAARVYAEGFQAGRAAECERLNRLKERQRRRREASDA